MSTRKSELDSPLTVEPTPPARRDDVCAHDAGSSDGIVTLLEADGARPHIKQLFKDLQQLQAAAVHAVWPAKSKQSGLYQRWWRFRREYQQAVRGEIRNPFTMDDVRLMKCMKGSGGPRDTALGENALGATEHIDGRWRWTFKVDSIHKGCAPMGGGIHSKKCHATN